MRKAIRWTLIFGFAFLTNYAGAYYALADREGGLNFGPHSCWYHFGNVNVNGLAGIFGPMHSVDRVIRPGYWSDAGGFRIGIDLGGPDLLVVEKE